MTHDDVKPVFKDMRESSRDIKNEPTITEIIEFMKEHPKFLKMVCDKTGTDYDYAYNLFNRA